jgi:ABC-type uncharacterized transport system substrate-binding protein
MNCERFYRAKLFARALAAANLLRRRAGFQNTVQMQATLSSSSAALFEHLASSIRAHRCMDRCYHDRCVQAHPHVWVTMKTELAYAPDGSVTAVQHAWTFDDMYSAFATQGIAARTNGQFALAELQPLARVNIDSLKEYAYFTYVKIDGRSQKDAFGNPTNYWLEYDSQATVLTLQFTLPFKQPVKARRLTVEIYDPEFFLDFGFAERNPVRLFGAPAQCTVTDEKPSDGFFSPTLKLNKSFMTSEANIGTGMNFANKISVTRP